MLAVETCSVCSEHLEQIKLDIATAFKYVGRVVCLTVRNGFLEGLYGKMEDGK